MANLRLSSDKMIAGVAGGVAEYLGVDATIVRIIWALLALSGTGLLAYFIVWIILAAQK